VRGSESRHRELSRASESKPKRGSRPVAPDRVRTPEKKVEGAYHHAEIARGDFSRTIRLPSAVDADKVEATFRDGILELRMPKLARSRRQRVEIK